MRAMSLKKTILVFISIYVVVLSIIYTNSMSK